MIKPKKTAVFLFLLFGNCAGKGDRFIESLSVYFKEAQSTQTSAKSQLLEDLGNARDEVLFVANAIADEDIANALVAIDGDILIKGALSKDSTNDPPSAYLYQQDISIQTNTTGRVDENLFLIDEQICWFLPPLRGNDFEAAGTLGIYVRIRSEEVCRDLAREMRQITDGGLFSDRGEEAFGEFDYLKQITDAIQEFEIGEYRLSIYYGAQEKPLNPLITTLLLANQSIDLIAPVLVQDEVRDESDRTENRSFILNTLEYKAKIPSLFGGSFSIRALLGDDGIDPSDDCGNLILQNPLSLHCELSTLLSSSLKIDKNNSIPFSLFLQDIESKNPRILFFSGSLEKNGQFDLTDRFLMIIEKRYTTASNTLFVEARDFFNSHFAQGEDL